jgi:hypothetical protein
MLVRMIGETLPSSSLSPFHGILGGWTEEGVAEVAGNAIPTASRTAVAARSGGRCEWCLVAEATDLHHLVARRTRDHSPENLIHLCRTHHSRAHANPAWAREVGLMRSTHSSGD